MKSNVFGTKAAFPAQLSGKASTHQSEPIKRLVKERYVVGQCCCNIELT